MNQKIKELLLHSDIYDGREGLYWCDESNLEKFAELIVRECARVAKKEQAYNVSHEIHVNIDYCILSKFGLKHTELTNE